MGYWRGVGDAPRGSLYRITWGADCLEAVHLQCFMQGTDMRT